MAPFADKSVEIQDNSFGIGDEEPETTKRPFWRWDDRIETCFILLQKCRNQPKIWDIPMPGVQKSAPNPGHVYARCA